MYTFSVSVSLSLFLRLSLSRFAFVIYLRMNCVLHAACGYYGLRTTNCIYISISESDKCATHSTNDYLHQRITTTRRNARKSNENAKKEKSTHTVFLFVAFFRVYVLFLLFSFVWLSSSFRRYVNKYAIHTLLHMYRLCYLRPYAISSPAFATHSRNIHTHAKHTNLKFDS